MAIEFQVLGRPGRDNALWVRVDSGQSITRLLFDCGDGCLSDLSASEVQATDHLFFSHLHMDHIGGFDAFFRRTFNRDTQPNSLWGPPETSAILHHRFQGFWWNLNGGQPGTWRVHDIHEDRVARYRYELSESFAKQHADGTAGQGSVILDDRDFTIQAIRLEHRGPSLGYLVREKPKANIQIERLATLGLRPGPWMQALKSATAPSMIEIDGASFDLAELRRDLLVETSGDSIAYLTDFLLDEATADRLVAWLRGCRTVVCEAQYRHLHLDLALRNHHTTTTLVSQLTARAGVERLILFHLSDRYRSEEWLEMLEESRVHFPATSFPPHWNLESCA